ncbi:patatin-like phospholipase family protein [Qipengyuania sediminis]|uniref:patatin-like phospholipase family protein n=1 Tax=Qipengyuania sediminis TaxID=1532023 RepID=UPI00105A77A3|nr:patatin-like phospholipase family protein [Qipengyuania sediminis]
MGFSGRLTCSTLLATALVLPGCNPAKLIMQPVAPVAAADMCRFERYATDVTLPSSATRTGEDVSSLRDTIADSFGSSSGDLLFLSGGSQHGAFGAGFLDQWHRNWRDHGGLPDFQVITGISTGALQATGTFIGRPEIAIDGYTIQREEEILEPFVDSADLEKDVPIKAGWTVLRRGALADLIPLRRELDRLLTDEVIHKVAERYRNERARLFVGVTDLDAGRAVALDMTQMAHRIDTAQDAARKKHLKACYIEALVASSIVPPGAKPVFIDNRMYIDGGVKFSVFTDAIGELIADERLTPPPGPGDSVGPLRNIYILYNGTAEVARVCGKADETLCKGNDVDLSLAGQHKDWSVPGMAMRALDLLTNQVGRLSAERAMNLKRPGYNDPHFVRIDEQARDKFQTRIEGLEDMKLSCAEWKQLDKDRLAPLEFYPRYMQCLIHYGRSVANQTAWSQKPSNM